VGREAEYDCQECGACCVNFFGTADYVGLSVAEARRLRTLSLPVVADRRGNLSLGTRPHDGPGGETICVAFAGEVGGLCGCSVYEQRPTECRRFEAGSLKCRVARQESGLPT
jgi:Fe-S-cluster containining protein